MLHNVTITGVLEGLSPPHLLFGTASCEEVVFIFVFGAFVHVHKPNRKTKFKSRANLGPYLGAPNGQHQVDLSRTKRVVTSRNLEFNEILYPLASKT